MLRRITIKRFDKELPLPQYKTKGAACFDCHVRTETIVQPNTPTLVPLNIALKPPKNHFVILVARSSFYKRGLVAPNGIGIGDEDFCGDSDEYHLPVLNLTNAPIKISRGDRIAQMLILPYEKMRLVETNKFRSKSRGGFGTTGK